jgi:hypothetical protein
MPSFLDVRCAVLWKTAVFRPENAKGTAHYIRTAPLESPKMMNNNEVVVLIQQYGVVFDHKITVDVLSLQHRNF